MKDVSFKMIYGYFYTRQAANDYEGQLVEIYKNDLEAGKFVSAEQMSRQAAFFGIKISPTRIREVLRNAKVYRNPDLRKRSKKAPAHDTIVYRCEGSMKELLRGFSSMSAASYMLVRAALGMKCPTFLVAYPGEIPVVFTPDKQKTIVALYVRPVPDSTTETIRAMLRSVNELHQRERFAALVNLIKKSGMRYIGG